MTTIKTQLQQDMKEAMREKDKNRLTTIRMIIDRVQKKEKEKQKELNENETIQILQTFKKQINEEIEAFKKIEKVEQVNKLKEDLNVVEKYLPKQISKEEIRYAIQTIIDENSLNYDLNKGMLMKIVMPQLKGKADNKMISEAIDEIIKGG